MLSHRHVNKYDIGYNKKAICQRFYRKYKKWGVIVVEIYCIESQYCSFYSVYLFICYSLLDNLSYCDLAGISICIIQQ